MNAKKLTLLTLSTAAATYSFAAPGDNVYTAGHGDIGVALEGGTDFHLHFHGHADPGEAAVINGSPITEEVELDAGDLTIAVPNSVLASAPNSPTFNAVTGVASGGDIWILPQSDPDPAPVPFLGIGAEELDPANWSTDITFTLDAVVSPSGSGEFSLWQSDSGLEFYFSTADGSLTENGNNTLVVPAGDHDHYNFGFSELGTWTVEITASGTHNTLGALSDTQTFTFNVVPEPSSLSLLFGIAAIAFAGQRRRQA